MSVYRGTLVSQYGYVCYRCCALKDPIARSLSSGLHKGLSVGDTEFPLRRSAGLHRLDLCVGFPKMAHSANIRKLFASDAHHAEILRYLHNGFQIAVVRQARDSLKFSAPRIRRYASSFATSRMALMPRLQRTRFCAGSICFCLGGFSIHRSSPQGVSTHEFAYLLEDAGCPGGIYWFGRRSRFIFSL